MRPKILVVEDEVIIAESLRRSLESSGYDVPEICATAEAAIEAARTYAPDLVLMDIRLKGEKDGIYAARIVSEGFDVPVIFVTAYGDDAVLERAAPLRPVLVRRLGRRGRCGNDEGAGQAEEGWPVVSFSSLLHIFSQYNCMRGQKSRRLRQRKSSR